MSNDAVCAETRLGLGPRDFTIIVLAAYHMMTRMNLNIRPRPKWLNHGFARGNGKSNT